MHFCYIPTKLRDLWRAGGASAVVTQHFGVKIFVVCFPSLDQQLHLFWRTQVHTEEAWVGSDVPHFFCTSVKICRISVAGETLKSPLLLWNWDGYPIWVQPYSPSETTLVQELPMYHKANLKKKGTCVMSIEVLSPVTISDSLTLLMNVSVKTSWPQL